MYGSMTLRYVWLVVSDRRRLAGRSSQGCGTQLLFKGREGEGVPALAGSGLIGRRGAKYREYSLALMGSAALVGVV
jgi:hypothetical protein